MTGSAVTAQTALFVCLMAGLAWPALGQPVCVMPAQYLAWPADEPIWRLCVVRPRDSGGAAGSGLELRDVYFRGRKVLDRAQIPMAAVDHPLPSSRQEVSEAPDLCAGRCFQTWTHQEVPFAADHQVSPGYYEPHTPAQTSCDRVQPPATPLPALSGGSTGSGAPGSGAPGYGAPGRCPWGEALSCVEGVAAESEADRWILTTEVAAAWYRYSLRWIFHREGRIEARAGVQSDTQSCARTPHIHHLLWRLDFDFAPRHLDQVITPQGATLQTEGVRRRAVDGEAGWIVRDDRSGRGYRLVPGAQDEPQSSGDLAVTLYEASPEAATAACAIDLQELVQNRPLSGGDPVLWYRSSGSIEPDDPFHCTFLGPTLEPVGRWPLPGELIFEDDFESGDTSAWSVSDPP